MKKNNGITLIALVITIIILLILAGITLAIVAGDNGILGKAQIAKDRTETAQMEEDNKLKELEQTVNKYELQTSRTDSETKSKYDTLWEGTATQVGDINTNTNIYSLTTAFTNYDCLIFESFYGSGFGIETHLYDTTLLKQIVDNKSVSYHTLNDLYNTQYYCVNFKSDYKSFWISRLVNNESDFKFVKIIGVKY